MNIQYISKPNFWAFLIITVQLFSCNVDTGTENSTETIDTVPQISKSDSLLIVDKIEIIVPTFL